MSSPLDQMDPADRNRLLSRLERTREELGGVSDAQGDHPLFGCPLEGARIGKMLGVGSFAAVFELEPENGGETLAVKVLDRDKSGAEGRRDDELFAREVDIGMRLDHPAITRIHRFLERPMSRFVVMDRVSGQTWAGLADVPITPGRYRELFLPFAEGLQYAHQLGIVHRDLKPENLMLTDDGTVRILDFGMARAAGGTTVTLTGQFKGTPMYCSPEQILDSKTVTPACDQFAFGLMSFELLTGQFPYPLDSKQPLQTLFARLQQPAARMSSVWPEAGAADEVMAKMLEQKPENRYPSVLEAFHALSSALP